MKEVYSAGKMASYWIWDVNSSPGDGGDASEGI